MRPDAHAFTMEATQRDTLDAAFFATSVPGPTARSLLVTKRREASLTSQERSPPGQALCQ